MIAGRRDLSFRRARPDDLEFCERLYLEGLGFRTVREDERKFYMRYEAGQADDIGVCLG